MKEQPIPEVSDDDVRRIALRDFGSAGVERALSILEECDDIPRVRLAVLKLAGGDLERLRDTVRIAVTDYRDVLAAAEYPRYSREIGFDDVAEPKEKAVIKDDWTQYQEWFRWE